MRRQTSRPRAPDRRVDAHPPTDAAQFVLRLYVSGLSARSRHAIENVRRLCETYLAGRCDLRIIDIYQQPHLAREQQLVAAPTLIKEAPYPPRKFVGDMRDAARVLTVLGVAAPRTGTDP